MIPSNGTYLFILSYPLNIMLTSNYTQDVNKGGRFILSVNELPTPEHLNIRIPPAWTNVLVDPDPRARILATGVDAAGRKTRIYAAWHSAEAKAGKFERVRTLLTEWEDIRTQIESDINDQNNYEAALVALLIYETGIRPGSTADTLAKVQAYGATTLQLRHVKPSPRGVRLQFIGKKGVSQNILVTNNYLVDTMMHRKDSTPQWSASLFDISAGQLRQYFATLGSGQYTPKDFRTACGTHLALTLIGDRKRFPVSQTKRKRIINKVLDQVARKLGNTRSVSRSAYVDPKIVEAFMNA